MQMSPSKLRKQFDEALWNEQNSEAEGLGKTVEV